MSGSAASSSSAEVSPRRRRGVLQLLHSLWPRSLRLRLLLFVMAAIVGAGAVQGVLAYRGALAEADALFDYHMQQTALALRSGLPVDAQGVGPGLDAAEENDEFVVQVWTNEGLRIFESAFGAALPQIAVLGFTNVKARSGTYRVFSLQTRSQVIQVAQNMAKRSEMARNLAWRTLVPLAFIAPLLVLVVWWGVSRSLAPVERVRRQLAQRQADDLSPVSDEALPDEVQPLVSELNLLFERVQRAFEAQQHFVADAAHELRSPLAALRLQWQGLQRAGDEAGRAAAIERLGAGIDRATRLVEQLLTLARQEASTPAAAEPVNLRAVAQLALADVAPAAQARSMDVGLLESEAITVRGNAEALRMLVRNLLDNAIKYTPVGGQVDVQLHGVSDQSVQFTIEDSGPGIEPAYRARVMQRFVRETTDGAPGSGLGLAIVQAIAQAHGATVTLDSSPRLGGLRVTLVFASPAA
ncbi:MAG: sensor histidine kinase N-terminal domain-containing protein [Burkholderiaceae bacterium]|nr:sensor histidine kinase N-terminal domain-containing protein [Burkholderiaceae bacterium]